MKKQLGFTYKYIADESGFKRFALTYHIVMVTTLFLLLRFVFLRGEYEMFDLETFEISKAISLCWMMGILAAMMASTYLMALIVRAYYKAVGSSDRIYEEVAMFYGFLTLLLFSVNLYGLRGIIWLPVSPPIALLGLQGAKIWLGVRC